ncbi:MAG: hypothetical protein GC179_13665 [Anaerolineaceae bacterium]|nr:hypothetical protein [Anaerolineaceae bacterium]
MNRYQKLMIAVIFLMLCSYSVMLGHGAGLLGLLILPVLAIVCTLIVKMLIDAIYTSQHHQH